ncbi:MAG: zf-HC2 domain-containing protein [Gemmatimonadota bacterium]|nr:zf-HC2 domain-containing protein [Gemmatimonadota bacterium]
MQHLDEGMIHAWLDRELPPSEREVAEAHVATCDECKAAVAEARGFVAASSRILTALDAVPGGVLPASSESSVGGGARAPARFRLSRAWMAAAAVLVLSTATIIAIRPRGETPAMRVADASTEATATAPKATAPMRSPAAPAEDRPALAGKIADKLSSRALTERKDERRKIADSGTFTVATAEPTEATDAAMAKAAPHPAAAAAAPSVAQAPASATPPADSLAKRQSLRMGQVVVTGEGVSSENEKLDVQLTADTATARVVSRRTSSTRGDTVVVTTYNVRGLEVVLIDETAPHVDLGNDAGNVVPRAWLKNAAAINTISWSDSTGHLRTLRGQTSVAELGRVKALLFGATP